MPAASPRPPLSAWHGAHVQSDLPSWKWDLVRQSRAEQRMTDVFKVLSDKFGRRNHSCHNVTLNTEFPCKGIEITRPSSLVCYFSCFIPRLN